MYLSNLTLRSTAGTIMDLDYNGLLIEDIPSNGHTRHDSYATDEEIHGKKHTYFSRK